MKFFKDCLGHSLANSTAGGGAVLLTILSDVACLITTYKLRGRSPFQMPLCDITALQKNKFKKKTRY